MAIVRYVWEPAGVPPAEIPLPLRRLTVRLYHQLAEVLDDRRVDLQLESHVYFFTEVLDSRAELVATLKLLYE